MYLNSDVRNVFLLCPVRDTDNICQEKVLVRVLVLSIPRPLLTKRAHRAISDPALCSVKAKTRASHQLRCFLRSEGEEW